MCTGHTCCVGSPIEVLFLEGACVTSIPITVRFSPTFPPLARSEVAVPHRQVPAPTKNSADIPIPAYCYHKAKKQAYVRLSGDFLYLGVYPSSTRRLANLRSASWRG